MLQDTPADAVLCVAEVPCAAHLWAGVYPIRVEGGPPILMGGIAQLANHHSKNPNCGFGVVRVAGWTRLCIVTSRPVSRYGQLFIDYGSEYDTSGFADLLA